METVQKFGAGGNKHGAGPIKNAVKLENETEVRRQRMRAGCGPRVYSLKAWERGQLYCSSSCAKASFSLHAGCTRVMGSLATLNWAAGEAPRGVLLLPGPALLHNHPSQRQSHPDLANTDQPAALCLQVFEHEHVSSELKVGSGAGPPQGQCGG